MSPDPASMRVSSNRPCVATSLLPTLADRPLATGTSTTISARGSLPKKPWDPFGAMIAIRSPRSRTSNSSARSPVMRTVVSVVSVAVTSTRPRPFST